MSNIVESFEHAGRRVEIHQDTDPESPREWDNLGTMVCFHRRYNLGDKHELRSNQFSGFEELRCHLKKEEGAEVILPLYLMDHSGITIRTSSEEFRAADSAAWDWGMVGFIYVSREKILKEWGKKRLTKAIRQKVVECLQGEVEVYDEYLTGQVYEYVVLDANGDTENSCCGMYGLDYCIEQAKEAAEAAVNNTANQAECAYA